MSKLQAMVLASALAVTGAASALEVSGEAGVVSDYVFRGMSSNNQSKAFQLGGRVDSAASGWYGSLWGSEVDFGDDGGFEVDAKIGWQYKDQKSYGMNYTYDVGVTRYSYTNDVASDFWELNLGSEFDLLGGTAGARIDYSPDINEDGSDSVRYAHAAISYGRELPRAAGVDAYVSVGYNDFEGDAFAPDYVYGMAGLGKTWAMPMHGDLRLYGEYHDTNTKNARLLEPRWLAGLRYDF